MYTNTGLSARLTASGNGDVVFKMAVFVTKIRLRVLDEETSVAVTTPVEKVTAGVGQVASTVSSI